MIRWLICLFYGHNIDKNDWISKMVWINECGGKLKQEYLVFYCKRCQRYKRIS